MGMINCARGQKITFEIKQKNSGFYCIFRTVFWGGFLWLIVWLASNQAAEVEAVRDVMIIILAMQSCVFGIAALILLVIVIRLVNMLEFEIRPILEKTNETLGTVQGTTTFVGVVCKEA